MASGLTDSLGNDRYRGMAFGWIFLLAMAAMNLFRGSTHLLTADGGAERIAGIDLSQNGEVILSLFAVAGFGQLLMAGIDLAVALRLRALVPAAITYHLVQGLGGAVILWWWRPLPLDAPGKFGPLFLVPLTALALWTSLHGRASTTTVQEAT
jgi:hypothetical protein